MTEHLENELMYSKAFFVWKHVKKWKFIKGSAKKFPDMILKWLDNKIMKRLFANYNIAINVAMKDKFFK